MQGGETRTTSFLDLAVQVWTDKYSDDKEYDQTYRKLHVGGIDASVVYSAYFCNDCNHTYIMWNVIYNGVLLRQQKTHHSRREKNNDFSSSKSKKEEQIEWVFRNLWSVLIGFTSQH